MATPATLWPGTQLAGDGRLDEHERLILVSNRGPLEHFIDDSGRIRRRDAGGGVAVALSSVARSRHVTWIAGASSFADRVVALSRGRIPLDGGSNLRLVSLPEEANEPFYNVFCNPLLWFVQHSMGSELRDREPSSVLEAWRQGYVRINRLFADAVIDELMRRGDSATVMLHDYHLYLVPTLIRRVVPKVLLQHFIHIPWPAPEEWKALPPGLVRQICRSLLENDSLGFQTDEHAANFIATCEEYLENHLNHSGRPWQLDYAGRAVNIWSNPISVEVSHLRELAASREVQRYREALIARPSVEKTIMRTDRLDPAKNVLAGFEAYDRLLERAPELHGRVRFVAFLVPSRCGIPEYDDYAARVFELVESINSRYGTAGWTPVEVHHEQNRSQALAGLMDYDVLLVNSLADGMNLVSKEGPVVNERDGVLVLSVRAGSYHQLQDGALSVDPVDVAATADALEAALALGPERRREGARTLRDAIEMHQLSDWLRHLIKDLEVIGSLRTRPRALLAG